MQDAAGLSAQAQGPVKAWGKRARPSRSPPSAAHCVGSSLSLCPVSTTNVQSSLSAPLCSARLRALATRAAQPDDASLDGQVKFRLHQVFFFFFCCVLPRKGSLGGNMVCPAYRPVHPPGRLVVVKSAAQQQAHNYTFPCTFSFLPHDFHRPSLVVSCPRRAGGRALVAGAPMYLATTAHHPPPTTHLAS